MNIPTKDAELFCRSDSELGEGPFWHDSRVYWVDIDGSALHSCDERGENPRVLILPSPVGAVAPWKGGFIAATRDGIGLLTPNGQFSLLPASPSLAANVRFNDGKLDPEGRFWCGTMEYAFAPGVASLYRVDRNGEVNWMLGGLTIANGLEWDSEAGLFYYIDTPTQRVDMFDYDAASGNISNRRVAFEVDKELGLPDGMARDATGRLWVACWRGSHVIGFDPKSGKPVYRIRVPTPLSSSCWIAPDNRTMYITSARTQLSPEERANDSLAGSVFRAELPD